MAMEAGGQLTAADLRAGGSVDYYSSKKRSWLPVRITKVDPESGAIEIDLRSGQWLGKEEQRGKLRRHMKPGKAQLEWARLVMGSDRYTAEMSEFFRRHASFPQGGEPFVTKEGFSDLAAELDLQLGICGSILALEEEAKPQASLTSVKFGCAFWKLLKRTLRDYGQALNFRHSAPRRGESAGRDYEVERELKRGTYGQVRLVRERSTGTRLAVKAISKASMFGSEELLETEVEHLCRVDHPNIVKLRKHYEDDENVYLVMDFCSGGDLHDHLKRAASERQSPPSEAFALHLTSQLMRAVAHVHARGIVHLDIKGLNIMLTHASGTVPPVPSRAAAPAHYDSERPHLMLIDLGVAQLFTPGECKQDFPGGTPSTMAPEVWRGEVTPAADIFSCGIVFWELCTLHLDPLRLDLAGGLSEIISQASKFWETGPRYPSHLMTRLPPSARELAESMLSIARQDRPSAQGCLESAFLARSRSGVAPLSHQEPKVLDVIMQLSKFASRSILYKSIALSIARRWQPNQLPTIQRVFSMFDVAGSGCLGTQDLVDALAKMGVKPAAASAAAKSMDLNKDGQVDWTEFVAASVCLGELHFEQVLRQHFQKAAAGGCECITSRRDFAQLLPGYCADDAPVVDMFNELSNGEPVITWPSFRAHFSQLSL
mmetsp:Transcript_11080/g.39146  ORF Transcript_11080/g.39146 Transcript_11080/m.39146 type:complete len:658 (+) Transcript_11080:157-2130(+)